MADNKKYYYLKLKDNFFESDEVLVLESMPDGYVYENILLKLYLRSLKYQGRLMFKDRIPFNSQMLATVTRHSVGDIEKAVKTFKQLGLIDILDNGAIYMLDIQEFIGKSSTEADRKKAYRQRIQNEKLKKSISSGQMSGQTSDKRTPELDIEIDKERDIDIEAAAKQPLPPLSKYDKYFSVISQFCEKNFGFVAPIWQESLQYDFEDWIKLNQDPKQVTNIICLALKEAAGANKVSNKVKYAESILDRWENNKLTTVDEIKADQKEHQQRQEQRQSGYRQHQPVQKEKVPDWSEATNQQQQYTPEQQEKLKAKLAALSGKKEVKS